MDLTTGTILIFSGEGEEGRWERYEGARTPRAIRSRLSRERCHVDRWASVWVEVDVGLYDRLGTDLEPTGYIREVPADLIRINPAAQLRAGKKNPSSSENGKRGGRPRKEQ